MPARHKLGRGAAWPIHIGYFEGVRLVVGWCELCEAFRNFRSDRIVEASVLSERFTPSPRYLRRAWREQESCPVGYVPRKQQLL